MQEILIHVRHVNYRFITSITYMLLVMVSNNWAFVNTNQTYQMKTVALNNINKILCKRFTVKVTASPDSY